MSAALRTLTDADVHELERYLSARMARALFLLSNSRRAGLTDTGQPYSGTYAAEFDDHHHICAVAAVYWNGVGILSAESHAGDLIQLAARSANRSLTGLIGLRDQVYAAAQTLKLPLAGSNVRLHASETLYELDLAVLRIPAALQTGRVQARLMTPADIDLVANWEAQQGIDTLGVTDSPAHRAACRANVERHVTDGLAWLLQDGPQRVARTVFNARIAEAVQVGGVWTPPEFRSRGYARCVVAASLLSARAAGAKTGVLFTNNDNTAANKAYAALGFQPIADWCLLLFRESIPV